MHNFIIQLIFHVRFLFLGNEKKKVESLIYTPQLYFSFPNWEYNKSNQVRYLPQYKYTDKANKKKRYGF